MKSIPFPEFNHKIGKGLNEPPLLYTKWNKEEESYVLCFELTQEEINYLRDNGNKIYLKQYNCSTGMNPMAISVFKNELIIENLKDYEQNNNL